MSITCHIPFRNSLCNSLFLWQKYSMPD